MLLGTRLWFGFYGDSLQSEPAFNAKVSVAVFCFFARIHQNMLVL